MMHRLTQEKGTPVGERQARRVRRRKVLAFLVALMMVIIHMPVVTAKHVDTHEEGRPGVWNRFAGYVPTFGGAAAVGGVALGGCVLLTGGICGLVAAGAAGATLAWNTGSNLVVNGLTKGGECKESVGRFAECAFHSETFQQNWNDVRESGDVVSGDSGWMALEMAASSIPGSKAGWAGFKMVSGGATGKLLGGVGAHTAASASSAGANAAKNSLAWASMMKSTTPGSKMLPAMSKTALTPATKTVTTAAAATGKTAATTTAATGRTLAQAAKLRGAQAAAGALGHSLKVEKFTGRVIAQNPNLLGRTFLKVESKLAPVSWRAAHNTVKTSGVKFASVRAPVRATWESTKRTTTLGLAKSPVGVVAMAGNPIRDVLTPDIPNCNGTTSSGATDQDGDGFSDNVELEAGSNVCNPHSTPESVQAGVIVDSPAAGQKFDRVQQIPLAFVVYTNTPGDYITTVVVSVDGVKIAQPYTSQGGVAKYPAEYVYESCSVPEGAHTFIVEAKTSIHQLKQEVTFHVEDKAGGCASSGGDLFDPTWQDNHDGGAQGEGGDRWAGWTERPVGYGKGSIMGSLPSTMIVILGVIALLVGAYLWYAGYPEGKIVFFGVLGIWVVVWGINLISTHPIAGILMLGGVGVGGWMFARNRLRLYD